jgi:hypothetical protein
MVEIALVVHYAREVVEVSGDLAVVGVQIRFVNG